MSVMKKKAINLEPCLERRYERLVMSHSNVTTELAAGMKALPDGGQSFSQTQALWRFLANDNVSFEVLSEPLLEMAHSAVKSHCDEYALAVHDWSRINYNGHASKTDRLQMSHERESIK